ncbi:MAG: Eco57I restriction-modification methylase domain-containing protein [Solirubrobacterales bacterium]
MAGEIEHGSRAPLGQVFTPAGVAHFIANSVPELPAGASIRLLDPGAGVGSLAAAAVERLVSRDRVQKIDLVACEIDPALTPHLEATLAEVTEWAASRDAQVEWEIREDDYLSGGSLEAAQSGLALGSFDIAILNPPYRKLGTRSAERQALEQLGVRVANLYTAFLAMAALHLRDGGALAAITPRSFANGLYHEPFRHFFFEAARLTRIHLFEARDLVFADSNVLQENLIFSAVRGADQGDVVVSSSRGPDDDPIARTVPYSEVVSPDDRHQFLRIPTDDDHTELAEWMVELPASLGELGLSVSTGRVVDFRSRESLRAEPGSDAVPLIYPLHLREGSVRWPAEPDGRKPNALAATEDTERLIQPNEPYVIVKRFTSKEERRRVSAGVCTPEMVPGSGIAFENHLNVFHQDGRGLAIEIAQGVSVFLNSTLIDDYVRLFNGHTQINATDLRNLRYPSLAQLRELGERFQAEPRFEQAHIDGLVEAVIGGISGGTGSIHSLPRAA